jgi:UDP-N-acetylglucosamine--N-acetylmuramyl-(pentapeptide) pyrophosphoryl-undecaprenol N-acetylglucosamine transferase
VIPALAVARELVSRGHEPYFIGTERGIESRLVPAAGFPIDWIEIGGLKRVGLRKAISTLAELPVSLWHASRLLARIQPAAVFSTGGYVAGPVLLAALWKRLPVVVMEPNLVPGYTHRRLARYVSRALVSFPRTARWFPADRTEITGLPVRKEFFDVPPKSREGQLTILITGGSQGSRTLNRAVEASWPLWNKGEVRLIHQTGRNAFEEIAPRFKESGVEGEIAPFFDDMPRVFAQTDLVVCRSGMGAVSELAAAGKASILVPLPGASDQHQLRNAEALAEAGAAVLVADADMTGERLVREVRRLAEEPELLETMGRVARAFAKPDAARRAADTLAGMIRS